MEKTTHKNSWRKLGIQSKLFLAWVDGLDLGKQSGSGDVQRNKRCKDEATKRAASEGRRSLPFREFG